MEIFWHSEQQRLQKLCEFIDDTTVLDCLNQGSLLIGGLDISYPKDDDSYAVAGLSVIRVNDLESVAQYCCRVDIDVPYIPGYLAFREVPAYLSIVNEFERTNSKNVHPHVFMVDSNGTLHPRKFGAACHLGVLMQRPTFGVAKNLAYLPLSSEINGPDLERHGLLNKEFKRLPSGQSCYVCDEFGQACGTAFQTSSSKNPIYVSPGHLITMDTALNITRACCKFRIPEPTRQADILTRCALRRLEALKNDVAKSSTSPLDESS